MDIVKMTDRQHDCIAEAPPSCECVCPLGINVRDFIKKFQSGLISAAYKIYKKFSIFPGIACHLCKEPCKDACVRASIDSSVSLIDLEKYCWQENRSKTQDKFFIPVKNKKVLIVGGGLTGSACAVKLAQRGYDVELIEKSHRLGGRLCFIDNDILPEKVLEDEMNMLFTLKHLRVILNTCVEDLDDYDFDAALIATGEDGNVFGAHKNREDYYLKDGVFFTGSLANPGQDYMYSIRQGSEVSYLLEDYIKINKIGAIPQLHPESLYNPDIRRIVPVEKAKPSDPENWTMDEIKAEASRCLVCTCESCKDSCEMLTYFNKSGKRLMIDVSDTLNQVILTKKTAVLPSMSCTMCGACKNVCPVDIDLKELCIETRRVLHKQGSLPDAHYDFWLNDMEHSNGQEAELFIPAGNQEAKYIYFPGCQMGASDPKYVEKSYEWLYDSFKGDTALMLHCCGAPAYWAAREDMFTENISEIKQRWIENKKPIFILSCPTCMEMFQNNLPEIEVISLWKIMADNFITRPKTGKTVSVFDPCTSRNDKKTQDNIRTLVNKAGYEITELDKHGEDAVCCGYGGLIYSTNPSLTEAIAHNNKSLGEPEYITYCTNCRDSFSLIKKPSRHILDLLFFNGNRSLRETPGLSERRRNRSKLKEDLLELKMNQNFKLNAKPYDAVTLFLTDSIKENLDKKLILEENIKEVIYHAEKTEEKSYCTEGEEKIYTAYQRQGNVTFWVRYKEVDGGYKILSAYTHRIRIEGV